ncbi:MAG: hydroxyethylthiazole kinase [Peptococcaceae bacterium]|nr:hydroxyethylthiazole kinase [Peptococcaceae bacterium]
MEFKKAVTQLLHEVREQKPLVHHITNYVTVNDCANIVLALGGSPVMADDKNEVEEMVAIASALVINIGTLNSRTIESMILAGRQANKLGIPVILDPVGIGATQLRTKTAQEIIQEVKISVLRGNMSEVKVLSGLAAKTRGVDSGDDLQGGREIALNLAQKLNCTVAVTGAKDIISDGIKTAFIENGHPMLAKVTGTGCMATSLVGTYCGVTKDYFLAAVAGIMTMGLAGEKAYQALRGQDGIGTFKEKLFDYIFNLSPDEMMEGAKLDVQ